MQLTEENVESTLINYLVNKGFKINKKETEKRSGPDIVTYKHNELGFRYVIECEGEPKKENPSYAQLYNYFIYGLGQIVLRMKNKEDRYALAFPDTIFFKNRLTLIPARILNLLNLEFFFIGEDKKTEHFSTKELVERVNQINKDKNKAKLIKPSFEKYSLATKENRYIWNKIVDHSKKNLNKDIRPLGGRGQYFKIIEVDKNYIRLKFKKSSLRLDSWRFIATYQLLKNNPNQYIEMGSNKGVPKIDTIERNMKEIEGNMKGLMTTLWVSTILANSFKNIEFVPKPRYSLVMKI